MFSLKIRLSQKHCWTQFKGYHQHQHPLPSPSPTAFPQLLLDTKCNQGSLCYVYIWFSLFHVLKSSLVNCFCLALNLNFQINRRSKFETCKLRGLDDFFRPFKAMKSESESCTVVSASLRPHGLYSPWNSPGQNSGVGSCFLFQGVFSIQGSNQGLPQCGQILYQLSHQGSSLEFQDSFKQYTVLLQRIYSNKMFKLFV